MTYNNINNNIHVDINADITLILNNKITIRIQDKMKNIFHKI